MTTLREEAFKLAGEGFEASERGETTGDLVRKILTVIVDDDLFVAVLDEAPK